MASQVTTQAKKQQTANNLEIASKFLTTFKLNQFDKPFRPGVDDFFGIEVNVNYKKQ